MKYLKSWPLQCVGGLCIIILGVLLIVRQQTVLMHQQMKLSAKQDQLTALHVNNANLNNLMHEKLTADRLHQVADQQQLALHPKQVVNLIIHAQNKKTHQ